MSKPQEAVAMDYKVGDIVALKSGGPSMTVTDFGDFSMSGVKQGVLCVWFDGSKKMEAVFPPDSLEHCNQKR
jgi:uncharacterized protein YodC (DUF2158 family)